MILVILLLLKILENIFLEFLIGLVIMELFVLLFLLEDDLVVVEFCELVVRFWVIWVRVVVVLFVNVKVVVVVVFIVGELLIVVLILSLV